MKKVAVVKRSYVDALESYVALRDALSGCKRIETAFCDRFEDIPDDADRVLVFGLP